MIGPHFRKMILAAAGLLSAIILYAQAQAALSFDVASVKPDKRFGWIRRAVEPEHRVPRRFPKLRRSRQPVPGRSSEPDRFDDGRLLRQERKAQVISFAYGNVKLHNPAITREDVERTYDELAGETV